MKKNTTKIFIAAVFLTISGTAFAQEGRVGINTSTPAATLDVVASPSNATRIDGFIAPRLKGSELKAKDALYTTAQEGAIVYVTEAVSGVTDKTTNVTSIGYYYFDKTQGTAGRWMKIANPSAAGIYQEPWNNVADGTPATTNTQNLYQTGDIGIRTNSPKATLDVQANDTGRPFGIIAPRVTAVQLRNAGGNFNADQDAALVYVTQEFGSSDTPTDRTSNVTSIGYYYFDKTQGTNGRWMKIANPTTTTYQEPWVVQGGTTLATTNSQAISQNASVAIGKSTAYNSTNQTMLDVAGAVRGGTGQAGVVGTNSAAFGNGAKATGTESFAIGNNTTASGAQSFAGGGNGAVASGVYAYSFGNAATAIGNHAVAMGVGTVAPARSSVTLGRFNVNTFTSADITANADGDPIFQLGAGADTNSRWNTITSFYLNNSPGWVAVGSPAVNTMPERTTNNERLRVYGGALANSAYVTDINSVTGANTDKIVVADATTGQLKTISATGSSVAYTGSTSVLIDAGNNITRAALTGDATAAANSNATTVVALQGKPVASTAPTSGQVLKWDGSKWAPAADDNTIVTSDNGLTKTANNIQLGGTLTKATTIAASTANTLAVTGLQTGAATDKVIVSSTNGVLKTVDASALASANYQEPWNVIGSTNPATTNTQDIYQTGKIGIGENTAISRLHVGGENTPVVTIRGNGTGNTNSYSQGGINFLESGANNWGIGMHFWSPPIPGKNTLRFQSDQGGSPVEIMTLHEDGLVGIGTIAPTNKLHVVATSNPVKFEGLQTGTSTDQIVTVGTDGVLKKVASTTLPNSTYQEPWNIQGGTTPSNSNSDNIYQTGSVAVGKNSVYSNTTSGVTTSAKLDIVGAVRVGINQTGAVGANSLAVGDGNTASGSAAFAAGQNTVASGNQSTALGNAGRASGNGSFAGGYWNSTNGASVAAGQSSFAFGEGANANSNHSLAFGKNAKVSTENGIVLGSYNELPNATNALFQLGNGTSSSNSNAVTVLTDGKTGIGTAAPTQKLDVNGASRLRGQIYDNNNVSGANGQVLSTNSSGQVVWQNNVAITPMAIGVMNNSAPSVAITAANYNTGTYIDLPSGKWAVNSSMLLTKKGAFLASDASLWIRAGFSTSSSSYVSSGNILSGLLIGPSQYGLMNGIVVINNTSGSTQRYYLWRLTSQADGSATGNEQLDNFAGAWGENQIVATPVN